MNNLHDWLPFSNIILQLRSAKWDCRKSVSFRHLFWKAEWFTQFGSLKLLIPKSYWNSKGLSFWMKIENLWVAFIFRSTAFSSPYNWNVLTKALSVHVAMPAKPAFAWLKKKSRCLQILLSKLSSFLSMLCFLLAAQKMSPAANACRAGLQSFLLDSSTSLAGFSVFVVLLLHKKPQHKTRPLFISAYQARTKWEAERTKPAAYQRPWAVSCYLRSKAISMSHPMLELLQSPKQMFW